MYHLEIQVLEHRTHGQPRIVHKDVDAAETGDGSLYQSLAVGLRRHITPDAEDVLFRAHGRGEFQKGFQPAGGHHDLGPASAEMTRRSQPYSGAGSRDDDHFVFEVFKFLHFVRNDG